MGLAVKPNTFNHGSDTLNRVSTDRRRRSDAPVVLRNRLLPALTQTVKQRPAKELAIATGIPWRTLENYRAGRECSLVNALLIMRAVPDSPLKQKIDAFLSGDADATSAEAIDTLVRFFTAGIDTGKI